MDISLKPWHTLGLGFIGSIFVALLATVVVQSYLWGIVFLLVAISWLFLGGITGVPVGFKGVPLFLGRRLGEEKIIESEGEKIPQYTGPRLDEGYHWIIPHLMSVQTIDTRMQVEKIAELNVFAKDSISVVLGTSITYRVSNPHQSLNVGGLEEIQEGINELMQAAIRDVAKRNESTELISNSELRKTIKERLLDAVKAVEVKFGVDIVDAFVGEINLPKKIKEALELIKQSGLYGEARKKLKEAGVPEDKIDEIAQLNLGVATKTIQENKYDVGATLSKAVENIGQGLGEGIGRSIGKAVSKNMADKIIKNINP